MHRVGIVIDRDPAAAKVRARFPDHDDVVSWWLPMVSAKTKDDRAYWLPDLGEHVLCLMDERLEQGFCLGAFYSAAEPPPVSSGDKAHVTFADGAVMEYDRAAHTLMIDLTAPAGTIHLKVASAEIIVTPDGIVLRGPRIDLN